MNPFVPRLISVDVGGTLGAARGSGITSVLAEASPSSSRKARVIMRDLLHTAPAITDEVVSTVCSALHVPESTFPRDLPPVPLALFPDTLTALHVPEPGGARGDPVQRDLPRGRHRSAACTSQAVGK